MLMHVSFTPIGTGEETKELLAKAVRIISDSGLDYQLTSMGAIVEGDWDELILLAKKCHNEIRRFADRVSTSITIDDRKDLPGRLKNNVLEIEYVLGKPLKTAGLT